MKGKGINIFEKIGGFVQKRSGWVIAGTILITLLLLVPIFFMQPDERASYNSTGEVYDIHAQIEQTLPSSVFKIDFVVEANDGDMLNQKELWELFQNEEVLRSSKTGKEYLYSYYDPDTGMMTAGIYTFADAVQTVLVMNPMFDVTLETATEEQVKLAVHYALSDPSFSGFVDSFSQHATKETRNIMGQSIDYWTSPVLFFQVNVNNSRLPLEIGDAGFAGVEHQKLAREVQEILRGDEDSFELYGIAIDMNLEAEDEGVYSVPLIIAAVVLIIIIVAFQFKSPKVALLSVVGLGMLIIWMKGLNNLIGLRSSLTLDIILPIAIIVLGVDYVIHALHRYREEKKHESDPKKALGKSVVGVGGALTLAMFTTFFAFLSSASSTIEETHDFGYAGAVAILSAFLIMGVFVPLVKMRWDSRSAKKQAGKKKVEKKKRLPSLPKKLRIPVNGLVGKSVWFVARHKVVTLLVVLVITVLACISAYQLEAEMPADEFFAEESDFVQSLYVMEEHIGDNGGEVSYIYIEGDMTEPESLQAIQTMVENIQDDTSVTRNSEDGSPVLKARLLDYIGAVFASNATIQQIENSNPGIVITDADSDGIPDARDQIRAIYSHILEHGILLSEGVYWYEPCQVREGLFYDPTGESNDATVVSIKVATVSDEEGIRGAEKELNKDMEALDVDSISYYGLTGSAFERQTTFDAINETLTVSIAIAIAIGLVILFLAFRSVKYAIATIIPVVIVAAWLYGFMNVAGFHLNYVTATIAAISIGVGVDYSVHITARYLAERRKYARKKDAMEITAGHSGGALFGSAISTFFGFLILAFAPMPMFSSFGILTAFMILMALVSALYVLPAMLVLVDRKDGQVLEYRSVREIVADVKKNGVRISALLLKLKIFK
jgi:predicted RND superfamily exporter protein